jgi:hypothetical protein
MAKLACNQGRSHNDCTFGLGGLRHAFSVAGSAGTTTAVGANISPRAFQHSWATGRFDPGCPHRWSATLASAWRRWTVLY